MRDRSKSNSYYERYRKNTAKSKECFQCNDPSWALRAFREKAAADTCSICFEDKPNIVTLCCGKAVHITCMTKWMSEKESCHHCRADMSSRPDRSTVMLNRRPMYHSDGFSIIHNDEMTFDFSTSVDSSYDGGDDYGTNRNATPSHHFNNVDLTHDIIEYSSFDSSVDDDSSTRRWTRRNLIISRSSSDSPQPVFGSKPWCFLPFEENLRRFFAKINIFSQIFRPSASYRDLSYIEDSLSLSNLQSDLSIDTESTTIDRENREGFIYVDENHNYESPQNPYTFPTYIFQEDDSIQVPNNDRNSSTTSQNSDYQERISLRERHERPISNKPSTTNSYTFTSTQSTVPLSSSMGISVGEDSSSNSSGMQEVHDPHHQLSTKLDTVPGWVEFRVGEETMRTSTTRSMDYILNTTQEIYPIPRSIQARHISSRFHSNYNTPMSRLSSQKGSRYEERYPEQYSNTQSRPRPQLRSNPLLPPSYNTRGRY